KLRALNNRAAVPWGDDKIAEKIANAYRYGHDAAGSKAPVPAAADFADFRESDASNVPPKRNDLIGLSLSQMLALPKPTWTVKGLMPDGSLGIMFGREKSGKTFYALELALCCSTALPFFDVPTVKDPLRWLYIASEGNIAATAQRIEAWVNNR